MDIDKLLNQLKDKGIDDVREIYECSYLMDGKLVRDYFIIFAHKMRYYLFSYRKRKTISYQNLQEIHEIIPKNCITIYKKEAKSVLYLWGIRFDLTGNVNNFEDASRYLLEENMVQYYSGVERDQIKSIYWNLVNDNYGVVVISTYLENLSEQLQNDLLEFINDQNSDGIGEGFSQQEFAEIDCGDDIYDTIGFRTISEPNFRFIKTC